MIGDYFTIFDEIVSTSSNHISTVFSACYYIWCENINVKFIITLVNWKLFLNLFFRAQALSYYGIITLRRVTTFGLVPLMLVTVTIVISWFLSQRLVTNLEVAYRIYSLQWLLWNSSSATLYFLFNWFRFRSSKSELLQIPFSWV